MSGVSEETKMKSFRLCKEFVGGTWADLRLDDFSIEHISGGLSNLLYMCAINSEKVVTSRNEPRKVMIRMYGKIIQENPETVVTDSVIFALLAEKAMGPKLIGVFTEGRVEEYIPSRHLWTHELADTAISLECARKMAKFHQLKMPLVKEPKWLFATMQRYLDEALNNLALHNCDTELTAGGDSAMASKFRRLVSFDLSNELQCLKYILSQVKSPVVFCHNDLQEGNILLMESGKTVKLMPIDFEYASYNYRGFDFGNHFCEWCYDYWINEAPYYVAKIENYPTREQQLNFVRAYLDEYGIEDGEDPAEVEENMILEAHAFALASHFLWGLWSIVQANISNIQFNYLDYALDRFDHYYLQKSQLPSHINTTLPDHLTKNSVNGQ